jgi:hypothetical protein
MKSAPRTFRDVIGLWPSKEALAGDVGATIPAVRKWWQRDSIPSEWWSSLTGTKLARACGIDAGLLAELAAHDMRAEARS